ncbi:MAG: CrcB family protein [Planctomycetes bacterium]|nr:CrcB family protein [Planctomycetota bacterium]MCB9888740.1 CrcB family protein [Planctomycetota bacterium]
MHILLIFLAGGAGSLLRFGLGHLVRAVAGDQFPYATCTVNLLGSFALGLLVGLSRRGGVEPATLAVVAVGFLGAFTTFSTFTLEAGTMLQEARWTAFAGYLLLQNALGVLCVLAGLRLIG